MSFSLRPLPPRNGLIPAATAAAGAGLVAAAAVLAARDDAAGQVALGVLAPLVGLGSGLGALLLADPARLVVATGLSAAAALVLVACAAARLRRPAAAEHLVAVACALAGQAALTVGAPLAGGLGYLAAAFALAAAAIGDGTGLLPLGAADTPRALGLSESAALLGLLGAAVVFRFYALNRVVDAFEGELSPYMVGATSLHGSLLANAGVGGPWAPLGLLYYLPIRIGIAAAGPTVLAVRLGSALVAVLTVGIGFLFAREVAGRRAGLAAAAMLALDPLQIGWGRSDVHPHGATAWPGLLLALATLRLVRTRSTAWAIAVAALMALTWHQYPSGQFAVAVPLLTVAALAVLDRSALRGLGWRLAALPVGLALWLAGFPVTEWLATGRLSPLGDYLQRLGPRVAGQASVTDPWVYLGSLAGRLGDLGEGVFVKAPVIFHQTFLPTAGELGPRTLPWAVAALAAVGVVVLALRPRRPESLVPLALLACGAVPAVLSDIAYVKRASLMYPAAIVVAAVAVAVLAAALEAVGGRRLLRLAAAAALAGWLAWAAVEARLWFSGDWYRWGRPAEELIAERVVAELGPGTLVAASFWDHYMVGKFTYLLSDDLAREDLQPVVWRVVAPPRWPEVARRPLSALAPDSSTAWAGTWSGLDRREPAAPARVPWRRLVVLTQETDELDAWVAQLARSHPELVVERLAPGTNRHHRMRLITCDLEPGVARE